MIQQMLVSSGPGFSLFQVLQSIGLGTNLKLCLDAGDSASYTSGQSWLDRSGNGYDFFLGADGSVMTDDPAFTGTVGRPNASTYWGFDGGDFFRYDSANETWMDNLHKDNAIFSILAFFYPGGIGNNFPFFMSNQSNTAKIGIGFFEQSGLIEFSVKNGTGTSLFFNSDDILSQNAWHMVAMSLTESVGSGGGFFYCDGSYLPVSAANTFTSTYVNPSASSASYPYEIGARGNGNTPANADFRLACLAVYEGTALTKVQYDLIWAFMRTRFNL